MGGLQTLDDDGNWENHLDFGVGYIQTSDDEGNQENHRVGFLEGDGVGCIPRGNWLPVGPPGPQPPPHHAPSPHVITATLS